MMKLLSLIGIGLLFSQILFSQAPLTEIEGDLKVDGKIEVVTDTNCVHIGFEAGLLSNVVESRANTFIGTQAGRANSDGRYNTFIGALSGVSNTSGKGNVMIGIQTGLFSTTGASNVFVGQNSGYRNSSGDDNVFLGNSAGFRNTSGYKNTYLGAFAGFENKTGMYNVMVGYNAGGNELGSHKLYIDNTATATPLIYGDFMADELEVNGSLKISDLLKLEPGPAPSTTEVGMIYFDQVMDKLRVFTANNGWVNLN